MYFSTRRFISYTIVDPLFSPIANNYPFSEESKYDEVET